MPSYAYRAIDSSGRVSSGVINAPDKDGAKSVLSSRGLSIQDLKLAEGAPQSQKKELAEAVAMAAARPGKAARGTAPIRQQTTGIFAFYAKHRKLINNCLIVLCFIAAVRGIVILRQPPPPPENYTRLQIVVKGRIICPDDAVCSVMDGKGGLLAGAWLGFHFPEIPLDADRRCKDILVDRNGNYEARFTFCSRRVPHFVVLTVRGNGVRQITQKGTLLAGEPMECIGQNIEISPDERRKGI
jgi:hypothetical protein